MKKLTFEDLATAGFAPHTTFNDEGPLGNKVLLNDAGEDIGAILLSGEYEAEDPFTKIMADVLAKVSVRTMEDTNVDSEET
jgi:hypothetical protein